MPWVHVYDVKATISNEMDKLLKFGGPQGLEITVRRPIVGQDGCWCLRHGKWTPLEIPEPHEHDPGLGKCPVFPAIPSIVHLEIRRRAS